MSKAAELAALIGSQTALSNKNLIINGAFQVFQRAAAATTATTTYTTADRWQPYESTDGAMTTEQSSDHPLGSGSSLKAQVTTADSSIGASQFCYIFQRIEAQNLQHLLYGTSSAKPLTLSFYVKSNKTGTYTINLYKPDNTAYNYVQEYTISSANTWEKKEITILPTAGSTSLITSSAGAINNDTGSGLELGFSLAFGSDFNTTANTWVAANDYSTTNQVNWMDSTSNNFYLTEVQLEVGETATPFEHRSFADEMYRCRRYFYKSFNYDTAPENGGASGVSFNGGLLGYCGSNNSGTYSGVLRFDPEMRATPTVVTYGNSSGHWGRLSPTNTGTTTFSSGSGYMSNIKASGLNFGQNAAGDTLLIGFGHLTASAEL